MLYLDIMDVFMHMEDKLQVLSDLLHYLRIIIYIYEIMEMG